ncbi:MAG: hypothetical protein R3236_10775, partial [Phycisphaeraceae bacterium]|nr:hypothetical protein [Phycisphaeraceae bacterium]
MQPPAIQNVRTAFEGVRFSVQTLEVVTDDGPVARERVVHPGAVVLLPVTDRGRYVLIRIGRSAIGERIWDLAGCRLDGVAAPARCAARELIEET